MKTSQRVKQSLPLLAAIALGLSACSKKVETTELQASFNNEPKTAEEKGAASAKPDETTQKALQEAVQSVKNDNLPVAVESLYVLRAQPNLTVDQKIAVQDLMGKVQTKLAERADKGDKAAQQALQRYRQFKTR